MDIIPLQCAYCVVTEWIVFGQKYQLSIVSIHKTILTMAFFSSCELIGLADNLGIQIQIHNRMKPMLHVLIDIFQMLAKGDDN